MEKGLCGAERQHSRGSYAWKSPRIEQPILCPPLASGVEEELVPQFFNSNCNPAQKHIVKLASTVGDRLEEALQRHPFFLKSTARHLVRAADLSLCTSEGILKSLLKRLRLRKRGFRSVKLPSLVISLHAFGDAVEISDGMHLREERIPFIRHELHKRCVKPSSISVTGSALFPEERTHLEGLACDLQCRLPFPKSRTCIEDLPHGHMVALVFHTEGEAAASGVDACARIPAALEGDRALLNLKGFACFGCC